MFISGLYLDGFGLYHQENVQDLPPGLVLWLGDNEAGKTTLMEFIRTVLFGFPRKGSGRSYPPLRGGVPGGRLHAVLADGSSVTVERLDRRATLHGPWGTVQAEPAERFLGGLDRATFEKIFAVDLDDLQGLEVLNKVRVRERLFSAGAGLAPDALPRALKHLDDQLGGLLTAAGRKQLIHQKRELWREKTAHLRALQGNAEEYARAQAQKERLEELLLEIQGEQAFLQPRLRRLEQLEQAWEPWSGCVKAREKLRELEFAQDFPMHGLNRLGRLNEELEDRRQGQKLKEGEAARLAERLAQLTPDAGVLAARELIEALTGERELFAAGERDLPGEQARGEEAETEFSRRLRELGPDWNAQRLQQVDTSVAVRQEVQELGRRLDAAERALEGALAQHRARTEAAAAAAQALAGAEKDLEEAPKASLVDENQAWQQKTRLRQLRLLLGRRELAAARRQDRDAARREAEALAAERQTRQEAFRFFLPWWLGIACFLAGFAVAGVLYLWPKNPWGAGLALAAGAVMAALIYILRWAEERAEKRRFTTQKEEADRTLENLDRECRSLSQDLETLDLDLDRLAREAGLSRPENATDLEDLDEALDRAIHALQTRRALQRAMEKAGQEKEEASRRLEQAAEEAEAAARAVKALKNEWEGWLIARGFVATVRPEGFEAVLQAVESARAAGRLLEESRTRLAHLEGQLTGVRSRIGQALARCGRVPLGREPGLSDLDAINRALTEAREMEQKRQGLSRDLARLQAEEANLKSEAESKAEQIKGLLAQAGAADEEEFRRLGTAHQERLNWLHTLEVNDLALLSIAGQPEAKALLMTELADTDRLQVLAEKDRVAARLQELNERYSQHDQEIGRLQQRLADLAQNELLGELLLEERVLREELDEAARRWAVLVLCHHLLEEARQVYERERQPQVVLEADRFLGAMTHGRYRLVATAGEAGLQLEDASRGRKDEGRWSAGLADQVYLAVRLGLAREFGRHTEPLPVILDDVLVKFDPRRRRGAARVILEFARRQQVLFFSCHPEFQEIFRQILKEPDYAGLPAACFHIADGVIERLPGP